MGKSIISGVCVSKISIKTKINQLDMGTTSTSTTPKELIVRRESLINDIKQDWKRINLYNDADKNFKHSFDVKAIYTQIGKKAIELVKIKVALQAINMGLKSMKELSNSNVYTSIFMLSQLKEQKVKLNLIPARTDNAVITKKQISEENRKLDTAIAKIEMELEKYNSETEFEL